MERSKKKLIGVFCAFPCPWCHKAQDLTEMKEQMLFEKGARYTCDKCQHVYVIDSIDTRPRVVVKQHHG